MSENQSKTGWDIKGDTTFQNKVDIKDTLNIESSESTLGYSNRTISSVFEDSSSVVKKSTTLSSSDGNTLQSKGSSTIPVYFSNGVPVQCGATLANNISGNAASAVKLQTSRTLTLKDSSSAHSGTAVSFDGTSNVSLLLPSTITASINGVCTSSNNIKDKDENYVTLQTALLNMVYPVGSIYMSVISVSPETFLGGTWVRWGQGKMPLSVQDNDVIFKKVEATGGQKYHKHETAYEYVGASFAEAVAGPEYTRNDYQSGTTYDKPRYMIYSSKLNNKLPMTEHTLFTSGSVVDTMPPYITCYMWKRTA